MEDKEVEGQREEAIKLLQRLRKLSLPLALIMGFSPTRYELMIGRQIG